MAISFDKALGIHQHTLGVRSKRAEVLANNIANADTPNYKAQDVDFEQALNQAKSGQSGGLSMSKTHDKHFDLGLEPTAGLAYRVPLQPDTGDGNTVDLNVERNNFMQNNLEQQMTLEFLGGKFQGMRKAIRGE
ncbi:MULTISPECIES: flagellar basal body rod protein FlgB [Ferrimonas]|uniref:Flagellar basal body rod protein FlgB n=1 Tax=Ferrimonas sediminum TaxID=718193 RepID=A0A1G8YRY1_9GAMM|nr:MULTISPECIES: flagellar basal body rod protein FlgB [Ferrimonas]USD38606.1 flagellar basal body rod protein FlgB [Ferrimonas sp. SCSIO 43195]SDK05609.1 flagellar basal-body rod protein FlgB [Ferrimonas sediminum]